MGSKTTKDFFFFFVTKTSIFISNMNDNFYNDSCEVYNISVRQELAILGFSPKIFFNLNSVISETMSFSDLNVVSNFS